MNNRRYFNYLVQKVNGKEWSRLLWYLYERPYIWNSDMDKNRVEDAYQLRENFFNPSAYILDVDQWVRDLGDASILEVLIALAEKIDALIMWDENIGDQTEKWFWGMIKNLGLYEYVDPAYDQNAVTRKVDIFANDGVLFPCRGAHGLDLWSQANRYFET